MAFPCPSCAARCDESARFCPACGREILTAGSATAAHTADVTSLQTGFDAETFEAADAGTAHQAGTQANRPMARRSSSLLISGVAHGRFEPGAIVASRYRIVGLLGRGGMGEVYRADDLTLGQPVALKFLPSDMSHDAERLARFRSEVSLARQVSHPNVCRVYDIGDVDGATFLSMEYIDGEDLASLLRRIGRLPADKGLEIARQICAGLAAAHDRGIVHRDLKPGNVMIDGRGQARIADFGLAAAAEFGVSELAGTPAYMAPEQFDGKPATIQSDIYALGLVLYEIFTGKRAFNAATLHEFAEQHRDRAPSSMTSVIADLDPAIERAIHRCLEKDPAARPPSALTVALSLPGGDPLAAAIARGETPAPEIVAAAGSAGLVRPLHAGVALAAIVVCLISAAVLNGNLHAARIQAMPKSPDVLRDRAQQIVASLGYERPPADFSSGFVASDFLVHTQGESWHARRDDLRRGRPSGILFWYRQGPRELEPAGYNTRVGQADPPETLPGMIGVTLDPVGRLHRFLAVPQYGNEPGREGAAPDWTVPFREAELDMSRFTPAPSRWRPTVYADVRAAWDGTYRERPDVPIHVEAAALAGRVVRFEVFNPWNQPPATIETTQSAGDWFMNAFMPLLLLAILLTAMLLAARNLRLGRGDRRGALRVASLLFATMFLAGIVGADIHLQASTPFALVISTGGIALLIAGLSWLAYLALEPSVRRRSPHMLIGWARLLSGRWLDPLVGRDILIGGVIGAVLTIARCGLGFVGSAQVGSLAPLWPLDGFRFTPVLMLNEVTRGVLGSLGIVLLLFSLTLVMRRRWIAAAIIVLIQAANAAAIGVTPLATAVAAGLRAALVVTALMQFGMLTLVAAIFTSNVAAASTLTLDLSQWYAPASLLVFAVIVGLALFGAWTSANLKAVLPKLLGE